MASVPKPGSRAFGERAAARREGIKQRERAGDLRVQTARRTVKESTRAKNKIISGD